MAFDLFAQLLAQVPTTSPTTPAGAWQTVLRQLLTLWKGFLQTVPQLMIAAVVVLLTAVVARVVAMVVRKVAARTRVRLSLQDLIRQLVYITVWIIGILSACTIIFPTLTPGGLLATLGLTSIAIGFAFKDIFENFFAGILILWRFPLEVGDYIECEEVKGRVDEITIRMTLVEQTDGQLVVLPNGYLFRNPVKVVTSRKYRRVTVVCGVAYGEDVDASRTVIQQAVAGCKTVNTDKPVQIFAQEFADSSINFEVTWWTGSKPVQERESRDEVVSAVKRALDTAGIEIPFPYRTLTFKEPLTTRAVPNAGE